MARRKPIERCYWSVTRNCQLACVYCVNRIEERHVDSPMVPRDEALRTIERLADVCNEVVFTGGEPLTHPYFWELVASCARNSMDVALLTNGIHLNGKTIERLLASRISRISVSLDSIDPHRNEMLRPMSSGKKGYTEGLLRNLTTLARKKASGLSISVLQTITRNNLNCVEPMHAFCRSRGLNLIIHPVGVPLVSTTLQTLRLEAMGEGERMALSKAMYGWAGQHSARKRYVSAVLSLLDRCTPSDAECVMGDSALFLDVDGVMYACFHRLDLRLGKLLQMPTGENGHVTIPRVRTLRCAECANLKCVCLLRFRRKPTP